ncbi:MAG TPA: bifunctional ADP-dependent NAD(P)H-hydrate dehydratase/NAD(P)H-hydrate epimerase [Opitutaceae bacterium]|jgi:NAD(P)H-hydrate epimerase|nr:bifunctional ADP-dependent NAD(P)H-hydrate dehydratase/NAD(P)H-hydrate epimerase [Opitutaceae bacterium]
MDPLLTPPILTCRQAADFEKGFFGGDEGREWSAMQAAGAAIAAAVARDGLEAGHGWERARVLALVGKGNNGGDAITAVQTLLAAWPQAAADLVFAFGERSLKPLAARAWQNLQQAGRGRVRVVQAGGAGWTGEPRYDLSLDGIFGFQFRPPLPAEAAAVLRKANALEVRLRAAVDLPSGLGDPHAFRADFTYATGSVKAEAVEQGNAGRIRYLDLGFFGGGSDVPALDRVLTAGILAPLAGLRPAWGDKRTYGHVFILGGSRSYPGAVLMNVMAALHSGVGLVTAFVPESLAAAYAARAPEAIWVGWPETPQGGLAWEGRHLLLERLARANAIALGSGMARAPETLALVKEVAATAGLPVLVDGDALQPEVIEAAAGPLLLTPHAGEFARIAGGAPLREYCARTGATVILKGPVTRVCSGLTAGGGRKREAQAAGLRVYHSFFGGPILARGGSGDVLAGLAAGQLAMLAAEATHPAKPALPAREGSRADPPAADWPPPLRAACRAAVWHGLAADALAQSRGQTAATVTGLIDHFPAVLRR